MAWTLRFSDSFTNTTGTLLPSHDAVWTNHAGGFEVNANVAREFAGGSRSSVATSLVSDQKVEAAIPTVNDSDTLSGVMLRMTNTGAGVDDFTGYDAIVYLGSVRIRKNTGVSITTLDTGLNTFVTGQVLAFTAVGSTLTAFINGVQIVTTTDATYTSGKAGIYGQFARLDDFAAYDDLGIVSTHYVMPRWNSVRR